MSRILAKDRECKISDCGKSVRCRGLCERHYRRLHYEERERDRRGAKKTPPLPIGSERICNGYTRVKVGKGREWAQKNRLQMESHIGRKLLPEETVHHKNGNQLDDRIENLELWASRHPKGQRVEDLIEFAHEILRLYGDAR